MWNPLHCDSEVVSARTRRLELHRLPSATAAKETVNLPPFSMRTWFPPGPAKPALKTPQLKAEPAPVMMTVLFELDEPFAMFTSAVLKSFILPPLLTINVFRDPLFPITKPVELVQKEPAPSTRTRLLLMTALSPMLVV